MGYDMRWELSPPTESVAAEGAARAAFDDACRRRGACAPESPEQEAAQAEVDAAYEAVRRADIGYFQLNSWGMGQAREELYAVGVLNNAGHGPYPDPKDFGLDDYPYATWNAEQQVWEDEEAETLTVITDAPTLAYLAAVRAWTDSPVPGDTAGIPAYKVGSNDGWLVIPGEIRTGIGWADAHHPGWRDELSDYVLRFVAWMEMACEYGGFRVR